jgi:hypothetical protein
LFNDKISILKINHQDKNNLKNIRIKSIEKDVLLAKDIILTKTISKLFSYVLKFK